MWRVREVDSQDVQDNLTQTAYGVPTVTLALPDTLLWCAVACCPVVCAVLCREGLLRGECIRGDMYIRDMKNTKGHVTGCTFGVWHPTDKFTAATCSEDGTVR